MQNIKNIPTEKLIEELCSRDEVTKIELNTRLPFGKRYDFQLLADNPYGKRMRVNAKTLFIVGDYTFEES